MKPYFYKQKAYDMSINNEQPPLSSPPPPHTPTTPTPHSHEPFSFLQQCEQLTTQAC